MSKRVAALSARKVDAIKMPGLYADGGGLYLQVTGTGAKTWIFRYQLAGRRRDMGLGSAATVALAEAREKALAERKRVAAGVDPIEARRASAAAQALAEAKATTFKEAAESYIAAHRAGWKNAKHAAQWAATLEAYAYPVIGKLPIGGIDTPLVLKVLEPIWNVKAETAQRVRGRIEAILDYAKVRGQRSGENPARWKGHLDHTLPPRDKVAPVKPHPALPYASMPTFWPRLQVQDGMGSRALEFAILTAARSGEVLGARWTEIDLDGKKWTVPAERMKAGQEHRVPLSGQALALLRKLAAVRTCDFVFPGQSGKQALSNMVMTMLLRRLKVDVTTHGFRSTFRTWVAEQTQFPDTVAEAALAHTIDDKVVAAYQRGTMIEKRATLMQAWADFVDGKVKVVAIGAGRKRAR